MKTLYLHIGTAKTATSSIQRYCADNKNVLLKYSYCYPSFPFKYSNVTKYRNGHFLSYPVRKQAPTEEYTKKYLDNLAIGLDIVHKCFEKSDNVILSEETLWLAICYSKYNPLQILKDDAESNNYSIKVIVYLRRQDAYLISRWNQLVKRQNLSMTFEEHLNYIKEERPLLIQYDKVLDKISNMVGRENVIVRRFEPDTWIDHSIYADFMDAIGIDKAASLMPPKKMQNLSLKLNAVEIKRSINSLSFLSHKEKAYLRRYIKNLSPEFADDDLHNVLSVDETKKLLDDCRTSNDRVAKEYLNIDTPLFSEEIKELSKWEPNNEFMTSDIVKLFSVIIIDQRNNYEAKNKELTKELTSLRNDYFAFKDKLRHPFRTIFNKIFRKGK